MAWKRGVKEENSNALESVKLAGKELKKESAEAKKATYAILGLGRYGKAVAKGLAGEGVKIICVDKDDNVTQDFANANEIDSMHALDVTSKETLEKVGVNTADTVIICMASSLAATVIALAHCKSFNAEREDGNQIKIIAKAADETQAEILRSLGADKVVLPEIESGGRLAKQLLHPHTFDLIEDYGLDIRQIDVKPEWAGRTLEGLRLRQNLGYNVIAIKDKSGVPKINLTPKTRLPKGGKLVVIAKRR